MVECSVHGGRVPDREAQLLRPVVTGSGPGRAVYACHSCVRERGLLPAAPRRAATYVGRRDAAPSRAATS